jgi:hypothetical protein
MDWVQKCQQELDRMANEVFETPELKRYFSSPLTWAGYHVKRAMWSRYANPTHRDCWAYVMGAAPIDVKQVIWRHEKDELIFDERLGRAHVAWDKEEEEEKSRDKGFEVPEAPPGVRVACWGRVHIAKNSPWLEGLAASHIIERLNNPKVVKEGLTLSRRGVNQVMNDLKVPFDELSPSARVHLDADEEHSALTWSVFERHVKGEEVFSQSIRGAKRSLDCFRVYADAVGNLMASVS